MRILRLALAFALFAAPSLLSAQQFPTVPSGTVIGRTQVGSGPAQAIPFSQLIALMLQSSLTIPTVNTNSVIFKGSTSGQATVQAQAVAGTPTLLWPNASGTIPSTATSPIVLDPASGNISCPTCATSTGAANPVVVSRAMAKTLNLSGASAIQTLGYAAGGDGGGATFVNVGTTRLIDQQITNATLVGGSGYTNGTYTDAPLTGGQGNSCNATITVSGGAVTALNFGQACVGYAVGDVLTTPNSFIGGTGSGFTWTVTATSTPLASFTDAVGTNFQYVVDQGNFINIRQFGAKVDFNGSDAGATNDLASDQAALNFAGYGNGQGITGANYGYAGQTVVLPKGASMVCGAPLVVPQGVTFTGVNVMASILKQCTSESGADPLLVLCNQIFMTGQFGCEVQNMELATPGTASPGTYVIYSNSGQQFPLASNLEILSGTRGCVHYEFGRGGAANAIFQGIDCESLTATTNNAFLFNSSNTQIVLTDFVIGCAPTECTRNGINLTAGSLLADRGHIEGTSTGIFMNNANGDVSTIRNITMASPCSQAIILSSSDLNNTAVYENISSPGCPLVTNGHSGGSNVSAGNIVGSREFNP